MKITQSKMNELLTQPGCEHNKSKHGEKKNKSCTQQPKPGAAQGGCAFDGAMIALVPITDAAHLVHGPIACSGNSWGSRGSCSSGLAIAWNAISHQRGLQKTVNKPAWSTRRNYARMQKDGGDVLVVKATRDVVNE